MPPVLQQAATRSAPLNFPVGSDDGPNQEGGTRGAAPLYCLCLNPIPLPSPWELLVMQPCFSKDALFYAMSHPACLGTSWSLLCCFYSICLVDGHMQLGVGMSCSGWGAGRDMTTGLLLDNLSPPDQACGEADEVPMGQLRRRLTLLQGAQVTRLLGPALRPFRTRM